MNFHMLQVLRIWPCRTKCRRREASPPRATSIQLSSNVIKSHIKGSWCCCHPYSLLMLFGAMIILSTRLVQLRTAMQKAHLEKTSQKHEQNRWNSWNLQGAKECNLADFGNPKRPTSCRSRMARWSNGRAGSSLTQLRKSHLPCKEPYWLKIGSKIGSK